MTPPLKFLFDECVGKPVMDLLRKSIIALSVDEPEFAHVLDFQKQGEFDDVWIPRIAQDDWIVVTSDRGRRGKKNGKKLPLVCKQHQVTHVALSGTIDQMNSLDKMAIILAVWDDMKKLAAAPKGSAHLIRLKGRKPHPQTPILVQIDPPPNLQAPLVP